MLAAPLLRVTAKKGTILPRFCTGNHETELAERILEEFHESYRLHERKLELYDRISAIESGQTDYKLPRGLCALLERRCVFSAQSKIRGANLATTSTTVANDVPGLPRPPRLEATEVVPQASTVAAADAQVIVAVDPIDVRRMLFEESSKRGFALTEFERDSIINSIAEKLRVSSPDIKKVMWSDLDDNLVFEHFDYIDAKTLIGWYNLSLMQTLLFNATKLEFHISGGPNWKRVLRNVKRLGLMYHLENRSQHHTYDNRGQDHDTSNSFIVCSLEGPLSLFKLTERYGTALAKLLPSIVLLPKKECGDWQIDAWIVRRTIREGKKLYQFKISSGESLPHLADPFYPDTNTASNATTTQNNSAVAEKDQRQARSSAPPPSSSITATSSSSPSNKLVFDSIVEEKFARKFNEVLGDTSDWKLVREPDPLVLADGKAFIPDFMIEKYGKRIYLEIVGFWTPEYLERKLEKVKQIIKATNDRSTISDNVGTNPSGAVDIFIAINEDFAGSKLSSPSPFSSASSRTTTFASSVPADKLILYKNDSVPIRPILDYLKALDKDMIDSKLKDPNLRIEIDRSRDIISLKVLAQKYDLPLELVSKIASRDYSDRYINVAGNGGAPAADDDFGEDDQSGGINHHASERYRNYYLISRTKVKELESSIKGVKTFADACAILSKHNVPESCHAELVEKLGYRVVWQSMDYRSAVIEKKARNYCPYE